MHDQELFEVAIMNVNLKKIDIIEPAVKINTAMKAIGAEPPEIKISDVGNAILCIPDILFGKLVNATEIQEGE